MLQLNRPNDGIDRSRHSLTIPRVTSRRASNSHGGSQQGICMTTLRESSSTADRHSSSESETVAVASTSRGVRPTDRLVIKSDEVYEDASESSDGRSIPCPPSQELNDLDRGTEPRASDACGGASMKVVNNDNSVSCSCKGKDGENEMKCNVCSSKGTRAKTISVKSKQQETSNPTSSILPVR